MDRTWKKPLSESWSCFYTLSHCKHWINFKQSALPHVQTKTVVLEIPQLCVFQFPALLALSTFSVAYYLTDYNKHAVLVNLSKDDIFSLFIFKKHFSFLKLKLTFDSKQLLCLISSGRKNTWEIPPFPFQTIDSGWCTGTKASQVFATWRTTFEWTYGKHTGAAVGFFSSDTYFRTSKQSSTERCGK